MDEPLRRLIALAQEHYRARDFDTAEKLLGDVLAQHHGLADVYNMVGFIHHDRGRLEDAAKAFEQALLINPHYTEAALNLAVTYNDLGKYSEAREIYAKAMIRTRGEPHAVDPFVKGKLANMHADLANAYCESGMYGDAVREYQRALELCPTFVDLRTRLATVHRDMGDPDAAALELEQVRDQSPGYVPARLALGTTYYTLGRRDEAAAEWKAVIEIDAGNRAARAYLRMASEIERGKPA